MRRISQSPKMTERKLDASEFLKMRLSASGVFAPQMIHETVLVPGGTNAVYAQRSHKRVYDVTRQVVQQVGSAQRSSSGERNSLDEHEWTTRLELKNPQLNDADSCCLFRCDACSRLDSSNAFDPNYAVQVKQTQKHGHGHWPGHGNHQERHHGSNDNESHRIIWTKVSHWPIDSSCRGNNSTNVHPLA
jgi:hypothetical protein